MSEKWVMIVALSLGWGGHDVKFQEFDSKEKCVDAADNLSHRLAELAKRGGKEWAVFCMPK